MKRQRGKTGKGVLPDAVTVVWDEELLADSSAVQFWSAHVVDAQGRRTERSNPSISFDSTMIP